MPFVPGLVSITFRQLPPAQVADLAVRTGIRAIEWGGDVHCPHGDLRRARDIAVLTRERGLSVGAYGSYYRLAASEAQGLAFTEVLASAATIGAPRIRVWAGTRASAQATPAERQAVVADAQRVAELAAAVGIRVVSEWHGGTLTDHADSGRAFLAEVGHANFATAWQPGIGLSDDDALAELQAVLPWLDHLHVFHWLGHERRPLAEGAARWRRFLDLAAGTGRTLVAALEFVRDDDAQHLPADAACLHALLAART